MGAGETERTGSGLCSGAGTTRTLATGSGSFESVISGACANAPVSNPPRTAANTLS